MSLMFFFFWLCGCVAFVNGWIIPLCPPFRSSASSPFSSVSLARVLNFMKCWMRKGLVGGYSIIVLKFMFVLVS